MADGLVRVRVKAGGKVETIKVSAYHVEEYLKDHPGAVALDDYQAMAAEPKGKDK